MPGAERAAGSQGPQAMVARRQGEGLHRDACHRWQETGGLEGLREGHIQTNWDSLWVTNTRFLFPPLPTPQLRCWSGSWAPGPPPTDRQRSSMAPGSSSRNRIQAVSEMTGCEGPGPALGSRLCWEAPGAKQMGMSGRGSPAVWRLPFCCGFQLGLGFSPFLFVFSVDLRHCRRGAGLHCHRQLPPQEGLGVWPVQLVLPWLDLRGGGLHQPLSGRPAGIFKGLSWF